MCQAGDILELQKSARLWPLYLAGIILCLHNTVLGLSFYYASVTIPYHANGTHGYLELSEDEDTTYVSLHQLAMLLGSLLSHPLGEKFGRKKILVLSNLVTILSFVLMALAPNYAVLLAGRSLSGFAVGLGILLPLVLLSEISTIVLRPGLANSCNLAINFGGLVMYGINMVLPPPLLPYSVIAFAAFFICTSIFLTESPHWLIRTGKMEEAEVVYRALRGINYMGVQREIKEVYEISDKKNAYKMGSRWKARTFLQPLGIICFMLSCIGLCGLDAPLSMYGPRMFSEFGFNIPYKYIMLIIPTGGFVGYCVALPLLKCMTKGNQYISNALLMALSTVCLGTAYFTKDMDGWEAPAQALLCAGSFGLSFGYGAGYGAVAYMLPGELLSPADKTIGVSIGEACRLVWTAVVIKIYPWCLALMGYPILFLIHTAVLLISALFTFRYLPETENKSLTEIQALFKKEKKLSEEDGKKENKAYIHG